MGVITSKDTTRIGISLKTGVDTSGNDVKKTMNLSKIKVTAADVLCQ
ncbi:MAG: DUF1659 domain-containing protein [Bacteroidota bacterium]|nr:DUF1659 domain-containing protein [Bacteroidota bacterium]